MKKPDPTPMTGDTEQLVRSAFNDIGALFEVLAGRLKEDDTARSLCTTGGYLCDNWADLITGEIEKRNAPHLSKQQLGELVLQKNRAPLRKIAPTGF